MWRWRLRWRLRAIDNEQYDAMRLETAIRLSKRETIKLLDIRRTVYKQYLWQTFDLIYCSLLAQTYQYMAKPLGNTPRHVLQPLAKDGYDFEDVELIQVAEALKGDWTAILNPTFNIVELRP